MQVIIGGATYQPAPIKTQPILYPANPSAVGTNVIGSPIQTDETLAPTGIHAVVSSIAPIHPLYGISAIPSGALDPIVASNSLTPGYGPVAPILQGGAPAPLPVAPVSSELYIIYAALAFLAYFLFRGE